MNNRPLSSKPTSSAMSKRRLFALVAVVGVGALLALAARPSVLAANAQNVKNRDGAAASKHDHLALTRIIDEQISTRIKENEMDVSERCTDAEFIRRVYLDIVGVIPPAQKVREFLDSNDPNKRAKLIDELLESPRYGQFFAEIWTKALLSDESINRRLQEKPLRDWLTEKFNNNTPWDRIVYDIVTASGPVDENGAVTFFVANATLDKVTDQITQRFLGVQLACAQCHNHPFTDWKQEEYWGMAAFFQRTGVNGNPNQAAKKGIILAVEEVNIPARAGVKKKGKIKAAKAVKGFRIFRVPPDGKKVPPSFLTDDTPPKFDGEEPWRPVVAKWITSKDNRFFSRAIVNKMWGHFFGRGIVNPVDDMHDDNFATHPELLKEMAEHVKSSNFDLKFLIRAICNSEAYQRSSRPNGNNADDREFFSRALVRTMSPEQLYDSLVAVVRNEAGEQAVKKKKKKAGLPPAGQRDNFIRFFSGDDGYKPLEYQSGIPQTLRLMNSAQSNATNAAVGEALKAGKAPADVIEYLYLATVSRRPTPAETERLIQYVQQQDNPRTAYGDILWALLNSSEFTLNR